MVETLTPEAQTTVSPAPSPGHDAADSRFDVGQKRVMMLRRIMVLGCLSMALIGLPALNLMGAISDPALNRMGRYMCLALAVVGLDLVWGYTGMLSLCQAVFFCLGGYAMGMHLSTAAGGGNVQPQYNNLPQFLYFANPGVEHLPAFWLPFQSLSFTLLAGLVVPSLVALIFGFLIFRSRVKGVYLAIVTQALAWGAYLAFNRNELLLGGTNGLTNFHPPLNSTSHWVMGFYLTTALMLTLAVCFGRYLTRSRLGRLMVAARDNEMRLYFSGYRPERIKLFAFCAGAVLAGIGGMLYVPQNGIITPNTMRVEDSILLIVCVAFGGRGTLWGALFGGLAFYFLRSTLTSDIPQAWPFVLGGTIITIILFLPSGLATLWQRLEQRLQERAGAARIVLSVLPLATIAIFVGFEAVKLMPEFLQTPLGLLGVHLKYWVVVALLLTALAGELALSERASAWVKRVTGAASA
jgi:urea transport system permease protein